MFKKPSAKQYRILAIIWALAAASMAVTIIRHLPQLNLLHLLLLVISLFVAASSWKSWKVHRKAEEDRLYQEKLNQARLNQDMEDESNE